MRLDTAPSTLDWTGQVNVSDAAIVENICEGLYGFNHPEEKLVPAIASSVKKSKDLTEYTFQIRDDAKWSDGRTIYAKDFLDGWQRVLSPQSTSIYSRYLFDIVNAREYYSKKITNFDEVGIRASSDKTLVVKFNHPQKNWEVTTAFWPLYPVRKDLIEKFGNNWWRAGTLLSTGPFVFSGFEPGKRAVLSRNPYYKKSNSNVDQVEIEFVLDLNEAYQKYQKKGYPFLSGVGIQKYFKDKDYHSIPLLRHYAIAVNTERFPLNNKFFRLAVLSTIDRKSMMPIEYSTFTRALTLIPSSVLSENDDLSVSFDLNKAKEYLKQSGVRLEKGFKITFLTFLNEPFYSISKRIADQIEKGLGIAVDTLAYQSQEFEAFSSLNEYNILMTSWTAKVRSPEDFLTPYSTAYSPSNRTHFSSQEYDEAIEKGEYKKAQLIIAKENAAIHPLFFESSGFLTHSSIKNLYFDQRGFPVIKDAVLSLK